jgi:hypothetical protein
MVLNEAIVIFKDFFQKTENELKADFCAEYQG